MGNDKNKNKDKDKDNNGNNNQPISLDDKKLYDVSFSVHFGDYAIENAMMAIAATSSDEASTAFFKRLSSTSLQRIWIAKNKNKGSEAYVNFASASVISDITITEE